LIVWEGGPTEEGYFSEERSWWLEGDYVHEYYDEHSRDCDGPHRHSMSLRCRVDRLDLWKTPEDEPNLPVWERLEEQYRDYYAERMGY